MAKELHSFYSKVAGVSRHQRAAKECAKGDRLTLEREPDNRRDPNAVKILRSDGEPLGYLPAHTAERVAQRMDEGEEAWANVVNVTGDDDDRPMTGINVKVFLEKTWPQWRVEGAEKKTGVDRVVIIDAVTEADARKEAKRQRLLVANVVMISAPPVARSARPVGAGPAGRKSRGRLVGIFVLILIVAACVLTFKWWR